MSEFQPLKNKTVLVLANFDVGLYKFRKALLLELIRLQNTVYISLPSGEYIPELERLGCHFIETAVDRRGMNPLRDAALFKNYRRIIKNVKPDLVISYTVKPNIYGGFACRLSGIPFFANITGLGSAVESSGVLRRFILLLYRMSLRKAKTVFFENTANRDCLVNAGVIPEKKTCILNGAGIDTNEYPLLPYPTESPIRFLFVGRIMKEKGVDELFEAAARLREEYGEKIILDVVGMFEESYEQRIKSLQEKGIIIFHGYQTDVIPFYRTAHCLVLPSYHEGMSNVLLEAASCGRPLITSNIPGCREAVQDGTSGFLCDAKNSASLYDAMKNFCELSDDARRLCGESGRKHMIDNFDKNKVIAETLKGLSV